MNLPDIYLSILSVTQLLARSTGVIPACRTVRHFSVGVSRYNCYQVSAIIISSGRQTFIEHLLWARHNPRCQDHSNERHSP